MRFNTPHRLAALALAILAWTSPVQAEVDIDVTLAPPALRVMSVPAARAGYHWAPGYWNWQQNHHVWRSGRWLRERPGYAYRDPQWVEHEGRWRLQRGGWARHDRDGDGVPNGPDRHPMDPTKP